MLTSTITRTLASILLALPLVGAGCIVPGMPTGGFGARSTTTASSTEAHTMNGQPVGPSTHADADASYEDDADDESRRSRKRRARGGRRSARSGGDFGATCQSNADCASNTCFIGDGEIGYCTKMCDSFSDCPSFWECEKAGNAPQRICQQD